MSKSGYENPIRTNHRFVLVGDCCSGVPGGPHEETFAAISARIADLDPEPDFICFLGDHIQGLTSDEKELRAQWRYWCEQEFGWSKSRNFPVYHLTSNHNTYDGMSEEVFREVFPDLPQNGPTHDRGLSYYVLRDDLLLVFTNSATARLGPGRIEIDWIAEVLAQHRAVPNKLVLGHYPVIPVNGYTAYPQWRIPPDSGDMLWRLLVEHGVLAYVCSHVIAYDVRARDGVLQVCSAGAGTRYGPTGAFMRGSSEYFHFLLCELGDGCLRCKVIDEDGLQRDQFDWPLEKHRPKAEMRTPVEPGLPRPSGATHMRFDIETTRVCDVSATGHRETIVCGHDVDEGPPTIWIGLEQGTLVVEIVLRPGGALGRWVLDGHPNLERFAVELVPEMGPGGVMIVPSGGGRSSLSTAVPEGIDQVRWPRHWCLGHGPSGPADDAFAGRVTATFAASDRSGDQGAL